MNVCVHGETTAHDEPGEARCAGPSAALPFRALEAILLLGVGFVIRPTVDALAAHDWLASAAGIAYLVIALRRIVPRLPSLSHDGRR